MPAPDRTLVLRYRLRVLIAAQEALAIPQGPSPAALAWIARRGRVLPEEIHAKLAELARRA